MKVLSIIVLVASSLNLAQLAGHEFSNGTRALIHTIALLWGLYTTIMNLLAMVSSPLPFLKNVKVAFYRAVYCDFFDLFRSVSLIEGDWVYCNPFDFDYKGSYNGGRVCCINPGAEFTKIFPRVYYNFFGKLNNGLFNVYSDNVWVTKHMNSREFFNRVAEGENLSCYFEQWAKDLTVRVEIVGKNYKFSAKHAGVELYHYFYQGVVKSSDDLDNISYALHTLGRLNGIPIVNEEVGERFIDGVSKNLFHSITMKTYISRIMRNERPQVFEVKQEFFCEGQAEDLTLISMVEELRCMYGNGLSKVVSDYLKIKIKNMTTLSKIFSCILNRRSETSYTFLTNWQRKRMCTDISCALNYYGYPGMMHLSKKVPVSSLMRQLLSRNAKTHVCEREISNSQMVEDKDEIVRQNSLDPRDRSVEFRRYSTYKKFCKLIPEKVALYKEENYGDLTDLTPLMNKRRNLAKAYLMKKKSDCIVLQERCPYKAAVMKPLANCACKAAKGKFVNLKLGKVFDTPLFEPIKSEKGSKVDLAKKNPPRDRRKPPNPKSVRAKNKSDEASISVINRYSCLANDMFKDCHDGGLFDRNFLSLRGEKGEISKKTILDNKERLKFALRSRGSGSNTAFDSCIGSETSHEKAQTHVCRTVDNENRETLHPPEQPKKKVLLTPESLKPGKYKLSVLPPELSEWHLLKHMKYVMKSEDGHWYAKENSKEDREAVRFDVIAAESLHVEIQSRRIFNPKSKSDSLFPFIKNNFELFEGLFLNSSGSDPSLCKKLNLMYKDASGLKDQDNHTRLYEVFASSKRVYPADSYLGLSLGLKIFKSKTYHEDEIPDLLYN